MPADSRFRGNDGIAHMNEKSGAANRFFVSASRRILRMTFAAPLWFPPFSGVVAVSKVKRKKMATKTPKFTKAYVSVDYHLVLFRDLVH